MKLWRLDCVECGAIKGTHVCAQRCEPCRDAHKQACHDALYFLRRAIAVGLMPEAADYGPCVDCGTRAECWDHRDYAKPLDVEQVCRRCNFKRGAASKGVSAIWARDPSSGPHKFTRRTTKPSSSAIVLTA